MRRRNQEIAGHMSRAKGKSQQHFFSQLQSFGNMELMNSRGLTKLEQARAGLREALAVLEGEALDPWRQVVVTCGDFMTFHD